MLDVAQNSCVTIPISAVEMGQPTLPLELLAEYRDGNWLFTFERLLTQTSFAPTMRRLLTTLERAYDYPVDIEFTGTYASNGQLYINLIQCRPLQTRGIQSKRVEIREVNDAQTLFRSVGSFMGGSIVQPIMRVIAVDSELFMDLTLTDKYELARIIGRLNRLNKARDQLPSLLMGPGRWGTSTPRLGVPVRFAEINAMTAIAEVSFSAGGLQPELSFGTHFFQDLVETGIFYVALDPDKQGCLVNAAMLAALPNRLAALLPDDASFAQTLRVVDLPPGYQLLADIMSQQVVCARTSESA